MSHSLNRTFSFNDNDETSLSANRQDHSLYPQPFQDIPSRDNGVSPLSRNDSPPLREYTVSPPSPPLHYSLPPANAAPNPPQQRQPSIPRRPLPPTIATSYQPNSYSQSQAPDYPISARSLTTPGADNLGATTAGGGIAGIAFGVAHTNKRDSGVQALRSMYGSSQPPNGGYSPIGTDNPYIPDPPYRSRNLQQHDSYSSIAPLTAAAATPGSLTPQPYDAGREMAQNGYPQERDLGSASGRRSAYIDNPYQGYSSAWDPRVDQGEFDPDEIDDDGDDGMPEPRKRRSVMGLGRSSDQNIPMGAVAGGAAAGGILGGLGTIGRKAVGSRSDPSGQYGPVAAPGVDSMRQEKLDYAQRQISRRKRLRWAFGILGALVIVGIVVGAVAGVLTNQKKNSIKASGGSTSPVDDGTDLDKNSPEILKLLGNSNLHKVFPGMDYTPFNAQYPDCLTNPPSQNNVTRDMAVLSQLTNAVRLYGTDCNQTEMVLHAIDKLTLTDMKVWLGVWLGNNATTNDRQLKAMYSLLDKKGATPFAGVIVGNEVLFRKDLTESALTDVLKEVKSNLTAKNINLQVATSDLGTDWTQSLADSVDIVMSNIHPFFGGVAVSDSASWTWNFWQTHDLTLTQADPKKPNIIAETGWPSAGGNDCGESDCTSPTQGSVAGITEMNQFMDDFVCQSLANGTQYFW